jgi:hypothetical protein
VESPRPRATACAPSPIASSAPAPSAGVPPSPRSTCSVAKQKLAGSRQGAARILAVGRMGGGGGSSSRCSSSQRKEGRCLGPSNCWQRCPARAPRQLWSSGPSPHGVWSVRREPHSERVRQPRLRAGRRLAHDKTVRFLPQADLPHRQRPPKPVSSPANDELGISAGDGEFASLQSGPRIRRTFPWKGARISCIQPVPSKPHSGNCPAGGAGS